MAYASIKPLQRTAKVVFQSTDWVENQMTVIRAGTPTNPGEIGPHGLPLNTLYESSLYRFYGTQKTEETGVEIIQDRTTGNLWIRKSSRSPSFSGVVFIQSYV